MVDEGFYYFEPFTNNIARYFKVDKVYYQGKTKYQLVQLFHNEVFGKVLFLDSKIQSAQIDEFIFHEALVHPALITHDMPQEVLVIGGGEGATLREILKHAPVDKAVMVDIDKKTVELCQEYLPEWSDGAFTNPKTKLIFGDARKYLERVKHKFDVIISDLTEPVRAGPSIYLFTKEFFEIVFHSLEEDGIFVIQAGSADPYYYHFFTSCKKTLEEIFPIVRPYRTFIFSFSLPWGFILASKKIDPLELQEKEISRRIRSRRIKNLKFYHSAFHKNLFSFPAYLINALKKGRILTDKKPFIWEA
ncbi:MAG: polyamine aminopropyltransferase [Candidatus Aminicenantaceae bacterium]